MVIFLHRVRLIDELMIPNSLFLPFQFFIRSNAIFPTIDGICQPFGACCLSLLFMIDDCHEPYSVLDCLHLTIKIHNILPTLTLD